MNFFQQYDEQLNPNEHALVARAQRFCAGPFSNAVHAAHSRNEPFDGEWIRRWASEGMLGLQARQEDGGFDASYLCKVRVAQEMARHSFAAAFCMNNLQGIATRVSRHGSPKLKEELSTGLISGSVLGALALTELTSGSDLNAVATLARPVAAGWLIDGTKAWVTNGTIIDYAILLARVAEGERNDVAVFVARCDCGSTVERHEISVHGARSFRLAQIAFRDHFVPAWGLLYQPGDAFKTLMTSINAARVHVAAMCVAALYAALCEATGYCKSRHAFGKPLLRHQGLRWELAEVATRLEAANAFVFRAASDIDQGRNNPTLAAQCKKFAVDTGIWGIDQCARAMGAIGASEVHRLSMLQAEVRMAAFADGTNEMLLDRIGRNLADDYDSPPIAMPN